MKSLLVSVFMSIFFASAVTAGEPKTITLSPDECESVAMTIATYQALRQHDQKADENVEKMLSELTINSKIITGIILENSNIPLDIKPESLFTFLYNSCLQAEGKTDVPDNSLSI